jgi:hypothetical protein
MNTILWTASVLTPLHGTFLTKGNNVIFPLLRGVKEYKVNMSTTNFAQEKKIKQT